MNDDEIKFWKEHLESKLGWLLGLKEVYPEFREFLESFQEYREFTILDIGSGAYNTLGCLVNGEKLNVTTSDYLAVDYARLMKEEYGIECRVQSADVLDLPYIDGAFDIVHASNAIDHCPDPDRAFKEMARVARVGVFMRHFKNVGKLEQYQGMHQWDFTEKDGGLLVADKDGNEKVYPELSTELRVKEKGINFVYSSYRKQ